MAADLGERSIGDRRFQAGYLAINEFDKSQQDTPHRRMIKSLDQQSPAL